MVVNPTQPFRPKEMMTPRSMSDATHQPITMRTSRTNGIEPTRTQPPNRHAIHVKLRSLRHPIQHTIPQTIRTLRIRRVCRRISRTGNLTDDSCPAAADDFMGTLAIVRSVAVQAGHEEDNRDPVRGAGFFRETGVERDGMSIFACCMGVGDDLFFEDWFPQRRGFEVDLFLALEGEPLQRVGLAGVAYVGEAGDAEDNCCAAEEF